MTTKQNFQFVILFDIYIITLNVAKLKELNINH